MALANAERRLTMNEISFAIVHISITVFQQHHHSSFDESIPNPFVVERDVVSDI